MFDTCTLAVLGEMNSSSAISPFDRPSATSRRTSRSRAVRPRGGGPPPARGARPRARAGGGRARGPPPAPPPARAPPPHQRLGVAEQRRGAHPASQLHRLAGRRRGRIAVALTAERL